MISTNDFKNVKKVKIVVLAASTALLLIPSVASAKASAFGKIYTQCGLGGLIGSAIDHKTTSQVIAVVTNITWDLGTTASTSYFSSQDTCKNKATKVAAFINQSYEKLEKDIASGDGKYLDALAGLALDESMSKSEYTTTLRENFSKIVASAEYEKLSRYEKVERLYNIAL